jgi:hypothetical protein
LWYYRALRDNELKVRASGSSRTSACDIRAQTRQLRLRISDEERERLVAAFNQQPQGTKYRQAARVNREIIRIQGDLDRALRFWDKFAPQLPEGKAGRPSEDVLDFIMRFFGWYSIPCHR